VGPEDLAALGPIPAIFFGVLGLLFGSFLNVCIVRWGAEPKQSVVRPRSRCPKCGHEIAWYENVPVVSWLVLRGRCKGCGNPISAMYPVVELAVGIFWGWMFLRHGVTLQALAHAIFGTLLLGIALTDARAFIIPHEFTLGGTVIALVLAFLQGTSAGLDSVAGALFGAGLILLVGEAGTLAFRRAAMGGGDVALMGLIGAFLGWQSVVAVLALGAVVSIVLHVASALLLRAPPSTDDRALAGERGRRHLDRRAHRGGARVGRPRGGDDPADARRPPGRRARAASHRHHGRRCALLCLLRAAQPGGGPHRLALGGRSARRERRGRRVAAVLGCAPGNRRPVSPRCSSWRCAAFPRPSPNRTPPPTPSRFGPRATSRSASALPSRPSFSACSSVHRR
jgi:leader peptidase (prepilin peptidase)/N-methyltransferase